MILIVEDDPIARRALQALFAARGLNVKAVPSAEDALDFLDTAGDDGGREAPDMVLIDIDLPGMSGLELLTRLRARHPSIPCTLMSANSHDVSGPFARAVPFLPKPLDLRRLIGLVTSSHGGNA